MQLNRYAFLGKTLLLFALLLAARFQSFSPPAHPFPPRPALAVRPDTTLLVAVAGRKVLPGPLPGVLGLAAWVQPLAAAEASR